MAHSQVLQWSTRLIALCLLVQMLICWPLWFSQRSYPLVNAFYSWPFSPWLSAIAVFITLVTLCLLIAGKQQVPLFYLLLVSITFLVLEDITRLQVWLYHLSVLLFVLSFQISHKPQVLVQSLRWIFPLIYIWGGIHKINPYYQEISFSWMLEAFSFTAPWKDSLLLAKASIVLEIAIGVGLYVKVSQKWTAVIGMLFHAFILLILSPLGHYWNPVVWPWNVAMMVLLYVFYWATVPLPAISPSTLIRHFPLLLLPLLLFGCLPAANKIGCWDDALSFKMYAGDHTEGLLYFSQKDLNCLPIPIQKQSKLIRIDSLQTSQYYLPLADWAFAELKVVPYASPQRLQQVARQFCSCVLDPAQSGMDLLEVRKGSIPEKESHFTCDELMGRRGY